MSDVAGLLAAADLVVLPSRREGHPMVLLEAMSVGAPIVATRIPGIEETAPDGEAARLVPPDDPSALSAALRALLEDPGRARRLGDAAAAHVRAHFGPSEVAARWAALYRAALREEDARA